MKHLLSLCLGLILALSLTTVAFATDIATDDGLSDALTAGGDVTIAADCFYLGDVSISTDTAVFLSQTYDFTADTCTINVTGSITVEEGATLSLYANSNDCDVFLVVSGDVINHGNVTNQYNLTVGGDFTNNGIFLNSADFHCWNSETSSWVSIYTITLDGGIGVCDQPAIYTTLDGTLSQLPTASLSGHSFTGWTAEGVDGYVTLDTVFTQDTILTANYSKSGGGHTGTRVYPDGDGPDDGTVADDDAAVIDDDATTKDQDGETTVSEDVAPYYEAAVLWAKTMGITDDTFATFDAVTYGQALDILYRAFGETADMTDWAEAIGIAGDLSEEEVCLRAQIITYIWQAAGEPEGTATHDFEDVAVGATYEPAVVWAVEHAITNGTSATTFSPENPCIGAHIVTFLYRFLGA